MKNNILKLNRFFNLKSKGFTLIELLVVISIIGVLGSTIYAPFNEARKKGRDAKRVAELNAIQSALVLFSDSYGGCYPIDQDHTDNGVNLLSTEDYKYISKTLFDKIDPAPSMLDYGGPVRSVNSPYKYMSIGNGDCLKTPSNNTDYDNMYFSSYQLFVALETHGSALDNDADGDRVNQVGTYRTGFNINQPETCIGNGTKTDKYGNTILLGEWSCIYDLSN